MIILFPFAGHIGFPEGALPVGNVKNYADRVTEQFLGAILKLAAAGKINRGSSPSEREPVEVIDDMGLKREAAAQVWLWDADKRELRKEREEDQ